MRRWIFLITALILLGCEVGPKPIAYGEAVCSNCRMSVSDTRYGAELVTPTGKVFVFDSIECMAAYVAANEPDVHSLWVTDYDQPERLVEVQEATFLQSTAYPSPMGASLTAFMTLPTLPTDEAHRVLTWSEAVATVSGQHGEAHAKHVPIRTQ